MVNTHDYQAGAGQQQLSFLQWDWVFLAPMIIILSGVWAVVNAHLHSQLASPILLCEDWDYHYSIHQHAPNFKLTQYNKDLCEYAMMDNPVVPIILVL